MFLITGSTGELGTAVIHALLNKVKPAEIAALVRDTDKAENWKEAGVDVRKGDYFYADALKLLLAGIKKLLLISAPVGEVRTTQHINVINVARQMGVKHIYYTSIQRKKDSDYEISGVTQSDKETESYLKSSGVNYTILTNTLYADSIPFFIGDNVKETGITFPAGNGKVPFLSREDLGEAIANLLIEDGHENKEYLLTNSGSWSFKDIAVLLSELTGKKVSFKPSKPAAYIEQLISEGIARSDAESAAGFAEAISEREYEEIDPFLEELLGRKPTDLIGFLNRIYS